MYALVVVFEILVGHIGFSFTTKIDPLAGGLIMSLSGVPALAIYAIVSSGRMLQFKSLSPRQRRIVYRLAAGSWSMGGPYVYGVHTLGIGTMTTMTAIGPLCLGLKRLWASRWSRMGVLHIALRVTAIIGIFVVNEAWKEFEHFRADMIGGIACGALGAWSFWNYLRAFFGDIVPDEEKLRLVAVADLISLPPIAITVWAASLVIGGGYAEMSRKVLIMGILAGALAFLVPTILTSVAAGKVSESVSGMIYVLDSAMANVIGLAGASLGLLSQEQAPGFWQWIGTGIVVSVSIVATLLPWPKSFPPQKELPARGS